MQQLDTEFVFKRLNMAAECGLRDVEYPRRFREAAEAGDMDEISDLPEFHDSHVSSPAARRAAPFES